MTIRKLLNIISVVLFFFIFVPVIAQNQLRFRHLTISDGLSFTPINDIKQDYKGFIWFATNDGLNRYDGYSIKVYRHNSNDKYSLSDNKINSIFEDEKHNLWIATEGGGLNRYNRNCDCFFNSTTDAILNKVLNKCIRDIVKDKNGNLWLAGKVGIEMINKKGEIQHYLETDKMSIRLSGNDIYSLALGKENEIWIASNKGLDVCDISTGKIRNYVINDTIPHTINNRSVNCICKDTKEQIWIGTDKGIQKYNRKKDHFQDLSNFVNQKTDLITEVSCIFEDKDENIWIGTERNGLFKANINMANVQQFKANPELKSTLNYNSIKSMFLDQADILWVGTQNNGINIYNPNENKFNAVEYTPSVKNSISDRYVTSIYTDSESNVWIGTRSGTQGGLNLTNPVNGKTHRFFHNKKDSSSLSNNNITFVFEDQKKRIWIGTESGLDIFNRSDSTFEKYIIDINSPYGLSHSYINDMAEDVKGNLLIATKFGLNIINDQTSRVFKYLNKANNKNTIRSNIVTSLLIGTDGRIWVGTENGGLNECLPDSLNGYKKCTFKSYLNSESSTSISANTVICLYEDEKKNIWVGTNNGLNRFNPKTEIFERFFIEDGLANNVINAIVEDNNGYLWISTNKGLSKFDTKRKKFTNYIESDGLQSNRFLERSCLKTPNGMIYFGGTNGYNYFFPEQISKSAYTPPVVITDFKINHKSVSPKPDQEGNTILHRSIQQAKSIELDYSNKIISFEFASLHFSPSENVKYAYMLKNFDDDWNYVGESQRLATYTNLSPGMYIFKLKATNEDGVWNNTATELLLIIRPLFWQTWWFRIFVIIVLLAIFLIIYNVKLMQFKRKKAELRKVIENKTNEISIQKDKIEDQKELMEQAFENIKVLSRIGNSITNNNSIEKIISSVYDRVSTLMDVSVFTVGLYNKNTDTIQFKGTIENGAKLPNYEYSIKDNERLAVICFLKQTEIIISDFSKEYINYIPKRAVPMQGESPLSIIYMPINLKTKRIGVITIQSFKKNAFSNLHFNVLKVISIYTTIALENIISSDKITVISSENEKIQTNLTTLQDEYLKTKKELEGKTNFIKNIEIQFEKLNKTVYCNYNYAQIMQQTILPGKKDFDRIFSNFVIHKPKNIVSGDFYWCKQFEIAGVNTTFLILADCTGHDVEGTFMSMLGNKLLNEIIVEEKQFDPQSILYQLDSRMKFVLKQKQKIVSDGMEVALVKIEKKSGEYITHYAGAKRPMYYCYKMETDIKSLKPARRLIGGMQLANRVKFTSHTMEFTAGDTFYLLTDGISNQLNKDHVRFKSNQFKALLSTIVRKGLDVQKDIIENTLAEYMEGMNQLDDITVIGIKL